MIKALRYIIYIAIGIFLGSLIGFSVLGFHSDVGVRIADLLNIKLIRDETSGLEIHSTAPGFSLYSLDGDRIKLSDAVGVPVVINFWATWCAPCLIEMPLLQERFDTYKPDLYVMAVNAGESKKTVGKFIEENELSFPTLIDPTKSVLKIYQIHAYPTTYFIDSQGVIKAIHIGVLSEKQLDRYLREIGVGDG